MDQTTEIETEPEAEDEAFQAAYQEALAVLTSTSIMAERKGA